MKHRYSVLGTIDVLKMRNERDRMKRMRGKNEKIIFYLTEGMNMIFTSRFHSKMNKKVTRQN